MNYNTDHCEVIVDGNVVELPYPIDGTQLYQDRIVLVLAAELRDRNADRDFDLPSDRRNIVAIDDQAAVQWFVEDHPEFEGGAGYFRDIYLVQGRLVARHANGRLYEIDPDSGDIVASRPHNEIRIGDTVVTVSGPIFGVVEVDGIVIVRCQDGEHDIHAFDADGTQIWCSSPDESRGRLYRSDGDLWEIRSKDQYTQIHYRVDPADGSRVEKKEVDTVP